MQRTILNLYHDYIGWREWYIDYLLTLNDIWSLKILLCA